MSSIPDVRKSRGRPPVGAVPLSVRVPPEQLAEIDAWIETQDPKLSRPEAIRQLAAKGLKAE
jgi:hypothetical protein